MLRRELLEGLYRAMYNMSPEDLSTVELLRATNTTNIEDNIQIYRKLQQYTYGSMNSMNSM